MASSMRAENDCLVWTQHMSAAMEALDFYKSRQVAIAAPDACRVFMAANYTSFETDFEAIAGATPRRGVPETRRSCSTFDHMNWNLLCSGRALDDCCALELGDNALHLPAITEVALRYEDAVILQDGWLRPFDVPTSLWPGSYLLARFVAEEPSLFQGKTVLELGTGVGVAALALCRLAAHVFATDISTHALALAAANLAAYCERESWSVSRFDWRFPRPRDVDLVVGASLQFDDPGAWPTPLPQVLSQMLLDGRYAILVHAYDDSAFEALNASDNFHVDRRVPSADLGLISRHGSSEFEVLVVRKKALPDVGLLAVGKC